MTTTPRYRFPTWRTPATCKWSPTQLRWRRRIPTPVNRGAADLEAVFDVPVQVSAVLGRARMEVGNLLKLGPGAVL